MPRDAGFVEELRRLSWPQRIAFAAGSWAVARGAIALSWALEAVLR